MFSGSLEDVFDKINRYLEKEYAEPLIVDVQNTEDLQKIMGRYKFDQGVTFRSATRYCNPDADPKLGDLYWELKEKEGTVFVTGFSVFLKLKGKTFLEEHLETILTLSIKGHVVVVTYQCKRFLKHILEGGNPRLAMRVVVVEGREGGEERYPSLVFASENFRQAQKPDTVSLDGIENLVRIEEEGEGINAGEVTVYTRKTKSSYPVSLVSISDFNDAYEVLCGIDSKTFGIPASCGTDAQWLYALEQFFSNKKNSWAEVIDACFGDRKKLGYAIHDYASFKPEKRWLYFIGLKMFGCPNNRYIEKALDDAGDDDTAFVKGLYRSILSVAPSDKDFAGYYEERKKVLRQLSQLNGSANKNADAEDFCKVVAGKEDKAIYYLTDNTQEEKEMILDMLDRYGKGYGRQKLGDILKTVYPDLAAYLSFYDFGKGKELLNGYFDDYKYQKVINRILPEFKKTVTEQAEKRDYNAILPSRASVVGSIDKTGAKLYFTDAMGVEFLSFIRSQCKDAGLWTKVSVCRCELPSITSCNKEFLDDFEDKTGECQTVSVKGIDEIKHHGKENCDYQKTKLPVHLIRELEIIKGVLSDARKDLVSGTIQKAVLIADHGASRLAVIHETENVWKMAEKGEHSGRCCLKSEVDKQPPFATDAGDFWALANYDRFKGGRKAAVEVHGGATLEEVVVPVIEITRHPEKMEVYLFREDKTLADYGIVVPDTPEIDVSYKKVAVVKIYVSGKVSDVSLEIDGKRYVAQAMDDPHYFRVELADIKNRTKTYLASVYADGNPIAENLPVKVKSMGMSSIGKGIL